MAEFLRQQAERESGESRSPSASSYVSRKKPHCSRVCSAGGLVAVPDEPVQEVVGTEVVSEEVRTCWLQRLSPAVTSQRTLTTTPALQDAKKYCREVMSAVRDLRQARDMSINEIKLTLAIEDPTVREQRDYLGIEVRPPTPSPADRRQKYAGRARSDHLQCGCRMGQASPGTRLPQPC